MIRQLKRKVLFTIMFFITGIILAFVTVINVVPSQREAQEARSFLSQLADNNGIRAHPTPPSNTYQPNHRPQPEHNAGGALFSVANLATAWLDTNGQVTDWFSDRQDLYTEDYLQLAAQDVLDMGREFGRLDGQYFFLHTDQNGSLLILLDNRLGFESARRTLFLSCTTGIGAWLLLLALAVALVNKMTRPVGVAFEKQRQFISDAGHELKTPIAVISANASVLESEVGKNKWLSYINIETHRMEHLVRNLMSLAEIDDGSKAAIHVPFDMSTAVLSAALPFESLAFERGMVFSFEVAPHITLCGNEEQLKQLVTILLSNAIKYGSERGVIRVRLGQERKKITLSVYNTGQGVEESERGKIFDRFYRVDKARSRADGGYGLGLAIAKAIVDEHRAQIIVDGEYGQWIQFTMVFPS